MNNLLSVLLVWVLLLCACTAPANTSSMPETESPSSEILFDQTDYPQQKSKTSEIDGHEMIDDLEEPKKTANQGNNGNLDITVKGLDDDALLRYIEANVYSDLILRLDSNDYFVENVEAVYYPKEYIKALAANSQKNLYFGYSSEELNNQFNGKKYVFTLGDNGKTVVIPMDTVSDDIYVKAMEDVIIGTGVILVCVTVSLVSAPAFPAVGMIFSASASTGMNFALQSGAISFAAAAITKGYETESFDQAIKAGAEAAGEGFKWSAIVGATLGGAQQAWALKGATLNGLTMNEAAKIQKESGYPLELIKQFKNVEEYEVYKKAGLYTKMVNGKLALVRDIDLTYVSELPNDEKVTNLVRMQKGYAPIDPATGKVYQLHHINQDPNGTLAILTESEHQGNSAILNLFGEDSKIDRQAFAIIRKEFWKKYAASLM